MLTTGPDTRIVKDPDAVNWPKGIDWTKQLEEWGVSETIANSSWTLTLVAEAGAVDDDEPLDNAADSIVTGALKTQLRLSGGTPTRSYLVTNHITTSSGIEDDRSFVVFIQER